MTRTNPLKKILNIFLIVIKFNRLSIRFECKKQYHQTKFLINTLKNVKYFKYKQFAIEFVWKLYTKSKQKKLSNNIWIIYIVQNFKDSFWFLKYLFVNEFLFWRIAFSSTWAFVTNSFSTTIRWNSSALNLGTIFNKKKVMMK